MRASLELPFTEVKHNQIVANITTLKTFIFNGLTIAFSFILVGHTIVICYLSANNHKSSFTRNISFNPDDHEVLKKVLIPRPELLLLHYLYI